MIAEKINSGTLTRNALRYSGANAGAKILAALLDAPSAAGVVVDARGLCAAESVPLDFLSGLSTPYHLLLGPGEFSLSHSIESLQYGCIEGIGDPTQITYTPATGSAFKLSHGGGHRYAAGLRNLRLIGPGFRRNPIRASIYGASTIGTAGLSWTANEHAGYTVEIIFGTGAGQARIIASNTATTATTTAPWDTEPSLSSCYVIHHTGVNNAIGIEITASPGAEGIALEWVHASGFRTGIDHKNAGFSFLTEMQEVQIGQCCTGIKIAGGIENTRLHGGVVFENGVGVDIPDNGSDVYGWATSFDNNAYCAIRLGSSAFHGFGCHFENNGTPAAGYPAYYIECDSASIVLHGGTLIDTHASGTLDCMVAMHGSSLRLDGTRVWSAGETIAEVAHFTGATSAFLALEDISGSPTIAAIYNLDYLDGRIIDLSLRGAADNVVARSVGYEWRFNCQEVRFGRKVANTRLYLESSEPDTGDFVLDISGHGPVATFRLYKQTKIPASPKWQANWSYDVTGMVVPTIPNGYYYECTIAGTTGGSEPTWPTTPGNTVTDGGVTWTCRAADTTQLALEFNTDGVARFPKPPDIDSFANAIHMHESNSGGGYLNEAAVSGLIGDLAGKAAVAHNHAAGDITSGVLDNARVNFDSPSDIGQGAPAKGRFTALRGGRTFNGTTSGNVTIDMSLGWNHLFELSGDVTGQTVTNYADGQILNILIIEPPAGGKAWTWSSFFVGAMVVDTGANKKSAQSFMVDLGSGNAWALGPGKTGM